MNSHLLSLHVREAFTGFIPFLSPILYVLKIFNNKVKEYQYFNVSGNVSHINILKQYGVIYVFLLDFSKMFLQWMFCKMTTYIKS